ncbi:MAG: thioredoxin family protein [Desulfobacteraceae bacterium]|nr:MAG: thioredoxin family protein [Desulfobacteraceae bacterium]
MIMFIKKSTASFWAILFFVIAFCSISHAADSAGASPAKKSAAPSVAANQDIQWQSYASGIKTIKDQKKKGYLHFYTDWCTYCKVMNKNTFTDPKIISYLNENFVPIRVNADQEKSVAKEYGANRFPSNFFIAEDATSLSNQPGYIPPEMLLDMLKFLHTDSFKTMKFSEFINQQEKKAADPGKP